VVSGKEVWSGMRCTVYETL